MWFKIKKGDFKLLSGYKLQYLRRLRGITQEQIAESVGISKRWVSKVECDNEDISEEVYRKWIDTLNGKIKVNKKIDKRTKEYKAKQKKAE